MMFSRHGLCPRPAWIRWRFLGTADGVYSLGCGCSVGGLSVVGVPEGPGLVGRQGLVVEVEWSLALRWNPVLGQVLGCVLPDWWHAFLGRWQRQTFCCHEGRAWPRRRRDVVVDRLGLE